MTVTLGLRPLMGVNTFRKLLAKDILEAGIVDSGAFMLFFFSPFARSDLFGLIDLSYSIPLL